MSDDNGSANQGGQVALIVVGIVLVIFGLTNLGDIVGLARFFRPLSLSFAAMRQWTLALGALVGGVLLIVFASRGGSTFRVPSRSDRLYRSRSDKMISGVMGGLATYLGTDPTLLRLALVAIALITRVWPVLVIYTAASIIMPFEPQAAPPAAEQGGPDPSTPAQNGGDTQ